VNLQKRLSALVAACLVVPVTPALASDSAAKVAAIFGSLFSYGYAGFHRSEFTKCDDTTRVFYQQGKDSELTVKTLGVSLSDCNLKRSDSGFTFRISPSLMASRWAADAGAGADSASEVTLVPHARYVWDMGPTKLDLMFGIGLSYVSETNIGRRVKSTEFQFSDELGIGISDASERVRLGYSYRHVSNANIDTPNNNVDFHGFTLTFRIP